MKSSKDASDKRQNACCFYLYINSFFFINLASRRLTNQLLRVRVLAGDLAIMKRSGSA